MDLGQRLPSAVGQLVQGEDATKNTDVIDISKSGLVDVGASLDRDYNLPRALKGPPKRLNGFGAVGVKRHDPAGERHEIPDRHGGMASRLRGGGFGCGPPSLTAR